MSDQTTTIVTQLGALANMPSVSAVAQAAVQLIADLSQQVADLQAKLDAAVQPPIEPHDPPEPVTPTPLPPLVAPIITVARASGRQFTVSVANPQPGAVYRVQCQDNSLSPRIKAYTGPLPVTIEPSVDGRWFGVIVTPTRDGVDGPSASQTIDVGSTAASPTPPSVPTTEPVTPPADIDVTMSHGDLADIAAGRPRSNAAYILPAGYRVTTNLDLRSVKNTSIQADPMLVGDARPRLTNGGHGPLVAMAADTLRLMLSGFSVDGRGADVFAVAGKGVVLADIDATNANSFIMANGDDLTDFVASRCSTDATLAEYFAWFGRPGMTVDGATLTDCTVEDSIRQHCVRTRTGTVRRLTIRGGEYRITNNTAFFFNLADDFLIEGVTIRDGGKGRANIVVGPLMPFGGDPDDATCACRNLTFRNVTMVGVNYEINSGSYGVKIEGGSVTHDWPANDVGALVVVNAGPDTSRGRNRRVSGVTVKGMTGVTKGDHGRFAVLNGKIDGPTVFDGVKYDAPNVPTIMAVDARGNAVTATNCVWPAKAGGRV